MIKRVSDINWYDSKYIRAGIIPFTNQRGVLFFGFGIDSWEFSLGDFGGHREAIDHDALDTAIREYREESLNVFGEINRDIIRDCLVFEGTGTAEILLPVRSPFYQYTDMFSKIIGDNIKHEVQSIVWLSRQQLLTTIDSQDIEFAGTYIYKMYLPILDSFQRNRHLI